jgi:hypothetical protein
MRTKKNPVERKAKNEQNDIADFIEPAMHALQKKYDGLVQELKLPYSPHLLFTETFARPLENTIVHLADTTKTRDGITVAVYQHMNTFGLGEIAPRKNHFLQPFSERIRGEVTIQLIKDESGVDTLVERHFGPFNGMKENATYRIEELTDFFEIALRMYSQACTYKEGMAQEEKRIARVLYGQISKGVQKPKVPETKPFAELNRQNYEEEGEFFRGVDNARKQLERGSLVHFAEAQELLRHIGKFSAEYKHLDLEHPFALLCGKQLTLAGAKNEAQAFNLLPGPFKDTHPFLLYGMQRSVYGVHSGSLSYPAMTTIHTVLRRNTKQELEMMARRK